MAGIAIPFVDDCFVDISKLTGTITVCCRKHKESFPVGIALNENPMEMQKTSKYTMSEL